MRICAWCRRTSTGMKIAKNITAELNQLIAQNSQAPVAPSPDQAPGLATMPVTPGQPNLSELIKGLKGDVTVESVPELGILILRGNPNDVDAVMKMIREIKRSSALVLLRRSISSRCNLLTRNRSPS